MRRRRLAETDEDKWFDKCDKLYPRLADGRCCAVCQSLYRNTPATEVHHIQPRVHRLLRFHPWNLMPLCHKHHQEITDKKLDEPITTKHREWLENMARKDFKGYCIAKGVTKAEYYEYCYNMLKELIL
jgi:5-methylcytosine-specific restriction endonuclease McrA